MRDARPDRPLMRPATGYQICTRTVMDTTDRRIQFDPDGVSNHWYDYQAVAARSLREAQEGRRAFERIADQIRKDGKGRAYDCVLGVSGGADSSYVAYLAKQYGFRPLVIHFDNGWDDELAVGNIQRIVERLGFDLSTFVIDWGEFRDLQLAYLRASVVDIEAITDHAILATVLRTAAKHRVKWLLSGTNVVTEAILPLDWIWGKSDAVNIRAIHAAHGTRKLKTFPLMGLAEQQLYRKVLGIQTVAPLDYLPYVKRDAVALLERELGWRDYGGKHYESVFTRFYQGHILPTKFGFDKRRAHLSTLICSGQLTREEALAALETPPYPDASLLARDREYVVKKLGLDAGEMERILREPRREHTEYATQGRTIYDQYPWARPLGSVVRGARRMLGRAS